MISASSHVRVAHYASLVEQSRLTRNRRLSPRSPTMVHTCGSAKVRIRTLETGIVSIIFTGPVTLHCIDCLERAVLPSRMAAPGTLERIDQALTMWGGEAQRDKINFPSGMPPSAVIVRPDQYARSLEFCALLARYGILRTCWLPHRVSDAHDWLEQLRA